ncbi:hypothetical protein Murru_0316 [Allomuricauda ruestringensis DSM 13258]|uniref:Uncharacterized protein n=2 Tax=Flagellimonas TaxID=444459 RepID=G2PSB5_ALLRU|nr:hypothetical protein Murru_0316 [Allomuricauda ruestringensis DSM 13258]
MEIELSLCLKVILHHKTNRTMKTIFTIIAVTFFGTMASAQDISKEAKVDALTVGVELDVTINNTVRKDRKMVRLYKFKNSRIKKELSFKTKKNKAKLA